MSLFTQCQKQKQAIFKWSKPSKENYGAYFSVSALVTSFPLEVCPIIYLKPALSHTNTVLWVDYFLLYCKLYTSTEIRDVVIVISCAVCVLQTEGKQTYEWPYAIGFLVLMINWCLIYLFSQIHSKRKCIEFVYN